MQCSLRLREAIAVLQPLRLLSISGGMKQARRVCAS
jgi:hypothetical protein